MPRIPAAIALLVLTALFSTASAEAGLKAGREAYLAGDYETAFREFLPLAEAGDVISQNQIAAMYYQGQGVAQDYAKAAQWFRRAAERGSVDAAYLLGKLYYQGQGVDQDFDEAGKWLDEAAQRGKPGAQYLLAILYLYGKGVPQNEMKAFFWAVEAADAARTGQTRKDAQALRDQIQKMLSKRQIESVRRMTKAWTPRR